MESATEESVSPEISDILKSIAKGRIESEDLAKLNKPVILEALKAQGLAEAIVTYEGSGDSGGIESCHGTKLPPFPQIDYEIQGEVEVFVKKSSPAKSGDWKENIEKRKMSLKEAMGNLADDFIDSQHGGFENNEGGYGTVTFDTETGKITMEHSQRHVEVTESSHEI